jgi:hypothetical protein
VRGVIYIGAYIVNKRGSFILTFPRQIFSSQQHPLFITRSPFRSVSVLVSSSLSLSLYFFFHLILFISFFSSGYYCYPRQSSVYMCVHVCVCVCVYVFCVSVYRHVFINPHIPPLSSLLSPPAAAIHAASEPGYELTSALALVLV